MAEAAGVRLLGGPPQVTAREQIVLGLVGQRYSNVEIAAELGISKRTVESHVAALRRKLAAPDRRALVRLGVRGAAPRVPEPIAHARQPVSVSERRRDLVERRLRCYHSSVQHLRSSAAALASSRALLERTSVDAR